MPATTAISFCLKIRFLQIRRQLVFVGGRPGKTKHVHADHLRVHFLERAGFDQGMDPFPRANGKMMSAFGADLEVLIEFLVENHRAAARALGPKALRNVALAGFGCELGLANEAGAAFRRRRRRRDTGLNIGV